MEIAAQLKREISRQFSTGSIRRGSGNLSFRRQKSLDPSNSAASDSSGNGAVAAKASRFTYGRQSSLDPNKRSPPPSIREELTVPDNLDSTMQLLFMASLGDAEGVQEMLDGGVDVNSIDLDGRTALHIAACEGHIDVVKLLLTRKANLDARDRWGSTACADAKYYGNSDVYTLLRARGAKVPKNKKTPMAVSNPREVPEYELNPCELQLRKGDTVTKGSYQVAKWNGTKVTVKILDKESYSDPESINAFKHELTLLERVRHPNVVQFVGAVTQNFPMMIVSEYHPKGDLRSYLQKKGKLQPHKALRFALDIARGVNYLHECKPEPVIHCDLKPKNILLDNGGLLKVAGFGLVRMTRTSSEKMKMTNHAADIDSSSSYLAPEIYKDEEFDRSVDAFSFGLVLYEMVEGSPAFHPKSSEEAAKIICVDGARPTFKTKFKSYPPELKELIEECWDPEPVVRPTFSEIIVRLDKVFANCTKQPKWKENLKLPWKS